MINSKSHSLIYCQDQLLRTNQHKYQANKQALNRILSMKSQDKSQKYQIKYRQLKRTYNNLLAVSKQLQNEYTTIINNMQRKHKQQVNELKQVNEIQIHRLKSDIKQWEMRVKDQKYKKSYEQESSQRLNDRIRILEKQNRQLLNVISELKRQNYIILDEKQRLSYESQVEMNNIKGVMDKLDFMARQLQITKAALQRQKSSSQILQRQLQQCNHRSNLKNQEISSLSKQNQTKNRTIFQLQKTVNSKQNNNVLGSKILQKVSSPRKQRIVMQIHHMIQNYKRNIRNY